MSKKWKAPAKYRLVAVEWLDSARPSVAWQWIDDLDEAVPAYCISIGFLVRESKTAICVAANVGDLEFDRSQACGIISIPVVAIKRMVDL